MKRMSKVKATAEEACEEAKRLFNVVIDNNLPGNMASETINRIVDCIIKSAVSEAALVVNKVGDVSQTILSVNVGEDCSESKEKEETKEEDAPLAGRWFHGRRDGRIYNQGQIIGKVDSENYLAEFYSFLDGEPNGQKIISLSSMKEWTFYSSDDEMREAYGKQVRL